MPELPDVEVFRKYIESKAMNQEISGVDVNTKRILKNVTSKKLASALPGLSFTGTKRHGKYLFLDTGDGFSVMLHFGMTGDVRYLTDGDKTGKHDRVVFHFDNGKALAYSNVRLLGAVSLVKDIGTFLGEKEAGPDALDYSNDQFKEAVGSRKSMIKTALMDQSVIAGLGNVYTDEILYQSRIHPEKKASGLSEKEKNALFNNMRKVLKKAIEKDTDVSRLPRTYLLPRRKEGAECPSCSGKIEKKYVSGRPTYYCPRCQGK